MLKLDLFYTDKICVFQLPTEELGFSLATKGLVNAAHRHNLAVHYWTINDEEEMRQLIDIGADGIMTDYPRRLQAVYNSYAVEQ
jgi:glycerophosphoryl diester phosphodiesterase